MELEEIKRGLRAEINKRENEQYATFQCNVRQMCKDVLVKLEEHESVIAEKDKKIQSLEHLCENYRCDCDYFAIMTDKLKKSERSLRQNMNHQKYKRCMAMAMWCAAECVVNQNTHKKYFTHKSEFRIEHFRKWYFRLLKIAEQFKESK